VLAHQVGAGLGHTRDRGSRRSRSSMMAGGEDCWRSGGWGVVEEWRVRRVGSGGGVEGVEGVGRWRSGGCGG